MRVQNNIRIEPEVQGYGDIICEEFDSESVSIKQADDIILIPKSVATAVAEAILTWVCTGGKAA